MKEYPLSIQTESLEGEYTRPKFDPSKRQFTQYVGYRMDPDSKVRTRRRFNFGGDETIAITRSVEKQQQYAAIVSNWGEIRSKLTPVLKAYDWLKPCWIEPWMETAIQEKKKDATQHAADAAAKWTEVKSEYDETMKQVADTQLKLAAKFDADAVARYLSSKNQVAVSLDTALGKSTLPKPTISIRTAMTAYITHQRSRVNLVGGKGLKIRSFNIKAKTLPLALGQSNATIGKARVDRDLLSLDDDLSSIVEKKKLEGIVKFWSALPEGIGKRTVKNYLAELKCFLKWCKNQEEYRIELPHDFDDLMHFAVAKSKKALDYDAKLLKGLLNMGSEKLRLYNLLALNCGGMYQQDISDLLETDLIKHKGQPCLWWFRSKEAGVEGGDSTFRILAPLWPETYKLLVKFRAEKNPFKRMFLNANGVPLVSSALDKQTTDNISEAFNRGWDDYVETLKHKPVKKFTFRQFRKIGWNIIKRLDNVVMSKLWCGQRISGIDFNYDDAQPDDYNDLMPVVARYRKKLIADGVLAKAKT